MPLALASLFELSFRFFLHKLYQLLYAAPKKNQKSVTIMPKIDDVLVAQGI